MEVSRNDSVSSGSTWDTIFVSPGDWTEDTSPQFITDFAFTPGNAQVRVQLEFTPSTPLLEVDPSLAFQGTQLDMPDSEAWANFVSVAELDSIFQSLDRDDAVPPPVHGHASTSSPASIQASNPQPSLVTVPQYGIQYARTAPVLLASVVLDVLSSNQVLFTFAVLSIMAQLRPQNDSRIGVTLTIYGHTVVMYILGLLKFE